MTTRGVLLMVLVGIGLAACKKASSTQLAAFNNRTQVAVANADSDEVHYRNWLAGMTTQLASLKNAAAELELAVVPEQLAAQESLNAAKAGLDAFQAELAGLKQVIPPADAMLTRSQLADVQAKVDARLAGLASTGKDLSTVFRKAADDVQAADASWQGYVDSHAQQVHEANMARMEEQRRASAAESERARAAERAVKEKQVEEGRQIAERERVLHGHEKEH